MSGINMNPQPDNTPQTRQIAGIYHFRWETLADAPGGARKAIAFIQAFDEPKPCEPFTRCEVGVRYSNGDEIRGQPKTKLQQ